MAGEVFDPGDEGWDQARQAWNLTVDQRPALVAFPESADDVAAAVSFARERGLAVAAQGSGHNASPLDLSGALLLKTTRMTGVEVDPEARRARIAAGTLSAEVAEAAQEHGLAAMLGSSHDVSVVGYLLGGGVSWMVRKHGLASHGVTAIELVTADGRQRRVDAENEPELFWALRGGGGAFGVVTALELELHPIATVYAGALFFPWERTGEVLPAWHRWVQEVPEEMTSVGRILQLPPLPDIPEPLRGRAFAVVQAAFLGDESAGAELLGPLLELGPEMDTFATIPAAQLRHLHMDPPGPVPGKSTSMLLRELSPEALEALVEVAGPASGSPLLSVELRHLGGAARRGADEDGALATIDAEYLMFAVGMAMGPEMTAAVEGHLPRVTETLAPWDAGAHYLNFCERPVGAQRLFPTESLERLRRVKAQYDPGDVVRSNHPIRAAA
jgi:hypothetical protein